jgi:putative membrane protein
MYDWHYGMHSGWMSLWWILAAVALAVILAFVFQGFARNGTPDSPEQILKRRYAGGEITREEFDRTLADLRR